MGNDEVLLRNERALGRITLNRPKALNALTREMCAAMFHQLQVWAGDPAIRAAVIDAIPGRAFCAGGDLRAIYESGMRRDGEAGKFFTTEYRLNAAIRHFPKPYIALLDGLAMGGAAGISVHGSHRVISENVSFAMPETLIGLFPDIGASFFLSRLPGEIGMYLALTGNRMTGPDMLYAGLATHFVPAVQHAEIAKRLSEGEAPDAILSALSRAPAQAPLAEHRAAIDRAFARHTVEDIIEALNHEGAWGRETAALLATRSPTSLKVTFRAQREGAKLDLESCLRMEYRLATRLLDGHDFYEGVRAAVIDKDQKPHWRPARLEDVSDAEIAGLFATLGKAELSL
jgi:enoyl-CoA hydratase